MGTLLSRVKANTPTTGTGSVTPSSAVSPYRTWSGGGAVSGNYYDYLIEDGTSWELGVGYYNGTTITRPGPGVDPYFESSSGSLISLSGAATIANVALRTTIRPFWQPPLASYFTPGNNSSANPTLTDDPDVGLIVSCGASVGASNDFRFALRTLTSPSLAWELKAKYNVQLWNDNYTGGGLILQNSTGRLFLLGQQNNEVSVLQKLTSFSGYAGSPFSKGLVAGSEYGWYRVVSDGTNITFYVSNNGKGWLQVFSETLATFINAGGGTLNKIGLYLRPAQSGTPGLMSVCSYFSLTGPAV